MSNFESTSNSSETSLSLDSVATSSPLGGSDESGNAQDRAETISILQTQLRAARTQRNEAYGIIHRTGEKVQPTRDAIAMMAHKPYCDHCGECELDSADYEIADAVMAAFNKA